MEGAVDHSKPLEANGPLCQSVLARVWNMSPRLTRVRDVRVPSTHIARSASSLHFLIHHLVHIYLLHDEWHEIEFFLDQPFQEEEEQVGSIGGDWRWWWRGFLADGRV